MTRWPGCRRPTSRTNARSGESGAGWGSRPARRRRPRGPASSRRLRPSPASCLRRKRRRGSSSPHAPRSPRASTPARALRPAGAAPRARRWRRAPSSLWSAVRSWVSVTATRLLACSRAYSAEATLRVGAEDIRPSTRSLSSNWCCASVSMVLLVLEGSSATPTAARARSHVKNAISPSEYALARVAFASCEAADSIPLAACRTSGSIRKR